MVKRIPKALTSSDWRARNAAGNLVRCYGDETVARIGYTGDREDAKQEYANKNGTYRPAYNQHSTVTEFEIV